MLAHPGVFRRTFMLSLAGTRGGPVRLRILLLLMKKPHNINTISDELALDYKTVEYHIRVMEKSGFVVSSGKKYDNAYTLSTLMAANRNLLEDLAKNMGKSSYSEANK